MPAAAASTSASASTSVSAGGTANASGATAAAAAAVPVAIPGPDGETIQCPHCPKSYSGKHARSIWRRHLQCKHEIPLSIQPRRTRWDGHANRPRNAEERRERMLESKRRWARKKRLQEKAAALGLPPGAEMSLIQQHMRNSATPDLDAASVESGSTSRRRVSGDAGPPAFARFSDSASAPSASPALHPSHVGQQAQPFLGADFAYFGNALPNGGFMPLPNMSSHPGMYYFQQSGPGPHQGQMPLPQPSHPQRGAPGQVPQPGVPLLPNSLPPGDGVGTFSQHYAIGLPLNGQGMQMPPHLDGDFSSSMSLVSSTSLPNVGDASFSALGFGNQTFPLSSGNLTAPPLPQPSVALPNRDAEVINLLQQEKRDMLQRMRQRKSSINAQTKSTSDAASSSHQPLGVDVAPPQSSAEPASASPLTAPAAAAPKVVAPTQAQPQPCPAKDTPHSDEAADAAVQLLVLASPDRPQRPKASSSTYLLACCPALILTNALQASTAPHARMLCHPISPPTRPGRSALPLHRQKWTLSLEL